MRRGGPVRPEGRAPSHPATSILQPFSLQDLARFNRFFIEKEEEAVIRLQVGTGRRGG